MGYFIHTNAMHFVIKKDNLEDSYKALCQLNAKDELKTGRRGGANLPEKPQDSTSVSNNPNKWFAWIDWNYDETCKSAEEIFSDLGFYTEITDEGDLFIGMFSNKCGDENVFLQAVAPFVEDGSYIEWQGEDGSMWKNTFNNGKMETQHATFS